IATWLPASIRKSKLSKIKCPPARTLTFSKLSATPFETEGQRDGERGREGDKETGRGGGKETWRLGDKESRRPGEEETVAPSPTLTITLPPCLLLSWSPCPPVSMSPCPSSGAPSGSSNRKVTLR